MWARRVVDERSKMTALNLHLTLSQPPEGNSVSHNRSELHFRLLRTPEPGCCVTQRRLKRKKPGGQSTCTVGYFSWAETEAAPLLVFAWLLFLKMAEVLPCVFCPLIDRMIDSARLYNLFSVHRHLTHKDLSKAHREDKTTMLIRFRSWLLSDKVFRPCACPVIRQAPVVLGLLTS